ncbi:uncharacterized protein LOC105781703 [Gossypium raimondii]|uniref:uncharacterized protein LOC105781703 n=1 Tax=Gossypium raimondii TaxID=29730 RepID=UPI00063AEBB0|nr:uncharacterized protein LOC105781703 [Gossypium raimondii]
MDVALSLQYANFAIGGVLRDSTRGWLFGFVMKVGESNIFQIKARAIYEGPTLDWKKGFSKVVIKSDNALKIDIIGNGYAIANNIFELRLIHDLCNQVWLLNFRHDLRELNRLADCMAKVVPSVRKKLLAFEAHMIMLDIFLKKMFIKQWLI